MPVGQLEVALLARQRAGLRDDDGAHEYRIAELIVVGHGLEHLPGGIESEIADPAHQGGVARIAGPAGQFRKDDVAPQYQLTRMRQAILAAIDVGLGESLYILEITQPHACDQRNGVDVPGLAEIMTVRHCQLCGELPRRECAAALQFRMRFGVFDVAAAKH